MRVLVIGATGYIGGRLVPELLARGHEVRCAARTPAKLDARPWRDRVEVAEADVFDPDSLVDAMADCDAVHFLVHSMDGEGGFADRDRKAAANVRDAAATAGVERIVYLGGLGNEDDDLSDHLQSRHEVGRVLADGPVPVTELRAAIIIGSGSASFEMLRHLCEVLPVMTTPKWVDTKVQPIAVRDVLFYLCEVLDVPETAGRVLEIGGPDILSYRQLMHVYAEVAGLRRRLIVPVPVLTPGLSSHWVGLVTPLPTGLAKPLVGSLINEVVVTDRSIEELVPRETVPFRVAVAKALERIQDLDVATTWESARQDPQRGAPAASTDARTSSTDAAADAARDGDVPEDPQPDDPDWSGGTVFVDERRATAAATPHELFAAVRAASGLPADAAVGEVHGGWSVRELDAPARLCLHLDRTLPGEVWVEFEVGQDGDHSDVTQRVRFAPRGLSGRVLWAVATPVRAPVLAAAARRRSRAADRLHARHR